MAINRFLKEFSEYTSHKKRGVRITLIHQRTENFKKSKKMELAYITFLLFGGLAAIAYILDESEERTSPATAEI
ncbi:MAG: hypothetical protein HON14_02665 [Rhodospirillaceae bacterium]|nr:hypothetical protein [Rhodospirillaceae bacterium]MBT4588390.1 hypothetical protein [Rhodospirillaceae bacterium]MBT4938007.1 hypothetical protein [Rhodospirillaceae bacterium]MBT5939439.1 hypothetical protein [Rhodospirillaceae bacterium]MBT7267462.1 hypothetical protein [Rhodospirillaceae bacterium]